MYSDIRAEYQGFDKDNDLVSYFNRVMERRDTIEPLEQEGFLWLGAALDAGIL